MDYAEFCTKRFDGEKLIAYGFSKSGDVYRLTAPILDGAFTVEIGIGERVWAVTRDDSGEEYVLHLLGAQGAFVGSVREAFEKLLGDVANRCGAGVFFGETAEPVIRGVFERYHCSLEFLWDDLPDAAVWRREDNRKWFGALLGAPKKSLGLRGEDKLRVIDVRADPAEIDALCDGVHYFRGYHMNKKHWLTMPLDGTVSAEEILERIEKSYFLAKQSGR